MRGNQQGSMLIAVIAGIVIISALGAGIASIITTGVRSSTDHSLSIQAFYLAESGVEWTGYKLRQKYENDDEWVDYCEDELEEESPVEIDDAKYFEILESDVEGDSNQYCSITVLGYVGSANPNNAIASRRISVDIIDEWIESEDINPKDDGIFSNTKAWNCGGKKIECEDGGVTLKKTGKGTKLTKNGKKNIVEDDAEYSGEVYFYTEISNISVLKLFEIGQKNTNFYGECVIADQNNCSNIDGDIFRVKIGDDLDGSEINDISQARLYVKFDNGDTVTFEWGCIGNSLDDCSGTVSQNPVDAGDWQEG